jgi:hypothetical protein
MSEFTVDELNVPWLDVPYEFVRQTDPIPASLRPQRRLALLLLLVDKCRSGKASWKTLHLLSWTVQSPDRVALIMALRAGQDLPDRPVIRFEPALDRAIDLARGLGLLRRNANGTYEMTKEGVQGLTEINSTPVLELEKAALRDLGRSFSAAEVGRLLEWRSR